MAAKLDPYRKWLGIPPEERPPNHYRLLGIALFESDPEVISNAADRQMAHVRSFQTGRYAGLSQRILNELSAARVCLLDPEKKAAYDAQLRGEGTRGRTNRPPHPAASPPAVPEEADCSAGIPLPFSTEPQFLADLEAGRLREPSPPEPMDEPPFDAFETGRARVSAARCVRRRRSPGLGLEIALLAVVCAAVLAALTWVWTHSSRSESQPSAPEGPPAKRAATGGPGSR